MNTPITARHRGGRRAAARTRRRLVLPEWSVTVLLALSALVVMAAIACAAGGAYAGWRWLSARGWLPLWAQLFLAAFALGVTGRALLGLSTGRAWVRTVWGAWRRRLRALT